MSEDTLSPITEYFAIVKSVTSRWATPGISKVERYTDGLNKADRSMSQCGKFYVYGTDYVFMSECFPLTIPFFYSTEDEIDVCNRAINGIRNEAYKRMEQAIEIPKARITELQQLTYQPKEAAPEPVIEDDDHLYVDQEPTEGALIDDDLSFVDAPEEPSDLPADDLDSDPDHDGM